MRTYIVRPGDTPASIAAQDRFAGCPKCSLDLIRANPHKAAVRHRNGYLSFKELRAGERLNLPDRWFDGSLDRLPKSYFERLPHPDGVTPAFGVGDGTLGDYATLDAATTRVSVLDTMQDAQFHAAADDVASLIDQSISEVGTTTAAASATFANDTHIATAWARQRNSDMGDALAAGDRTTAAAARFDVRNALTTALGSARLSLQSFYGGPGPIPPITVATTATTQTTATSPIPSAQVQASVQTQPTAQPKISTASVLGISLIGAGVVGGAYYYWATRRRGRRIRRVRAW